MTSRERTWLQAEAINRDLIIQKPRLNLATRAAQIGVWDYDVEKQTLIWDDEMFVLYGANKADFDGAYEAWASHLHPEEKARCEQELQYAIAGIKPFNTEFRVLYDDGSEHFLKAIADTQLNASGKCVRMVGVNWDITEHKLAELEILHQRNNLEEIVAEKTSALVLSEHNTQVANRAKSEFLANMSHEIRTPMNAIIGMSRLALKCNLDAKSRDYVKKISYGANSLLRIINEILDFSKIDAGKLEIEIQLFGINEMITNLTAMVIDAAHQKNLEFLINLDREVPRSLLGDSVRLGQVLINLCGNAIKFTERGQVVVNISFIGREANQVRLRFLIEDQGIGMSAEQVAKLFSAFTQADGSITRKYGGTGLGLVISKKLVALMGGELTVHSTLGLGTTFQFDIGLEVAPYQMPVQWQDTVISGYRALVVDDNQAACEILSDLLTNFGLRVDAVSNGGKAMSAIKHADALDPYKLVFMDWRMSDVDGIETTRMVLRELVLAQPPSIVMVTSADATDIQVEAMTAGAVAVLEKPVNQSSLWDVIANIYAEQLSARKGGGH